MTYFFDNNISPSIVAILKILQVDACHLRDHFASDTPDETWIPDVGARGWTVVTADVMIYKNAAQRAVLVQANVKTLWLPPGYLKKDMWEQAGWFVRYWQKIQQQSEREQHRKLLRVTDNGNIEPMQSKS